MGDRALDIQILDADGLIACPGLIDTHVHFRDPGYCYKEDIESGARAAAAGGFTTVVMMANTNPVADNPDIILDMLDRGKKTKINARTVAAVTKGLLGKEITDMEALIAAGAAGFSDDGKPIIDEVVTKEAFERAARLGAVISLHEEDSAYIKENGINAGEAARLLGIGGADREAEISLARRDIMLAEKTGARICIQHISAKETVELVRRAKERGIDVHAEATPHHFSLTESAVAEYGSLAKVNPPLRCEEDRQAIIQGLRDGTIDIIASDHAPHSNEEKALPLTKAPSGMIGLESSLALGITNLVKPGFLTLPELIEKMTINPAKLYGFDAGTIAVGKYADITIFDKDEEFILKDFKSKSRNTPFAGKKVFGKVKATICKGRIIYS